MKSVLDQPTLIAVQEPLGTGGDLVVVRWFLARLGRCGDDREGGAVLAQLAGPPDAAADVEEAPSNSKPSARQSPVTTPVLAFRS